MFTTQTLADFDQIKIIADAQRLALLRRLMAGPASLAELGRHFDETPAHLRHHLKALEQVGVVALDSTRPVRGFTEKRYRATADTYLIRLAILPERLSYPCASALGNTTERGASEKKWDLNPLLPAEGVMPTAQAEALARDLVVIVERMESVAEAMSMLYNPTDQQSQTMNAIRVLVERFKTELNTFHCGATVERGGAYR
jgi:DNA-binding transcriptional ArsR family regulator